MHSGLNNKDRVPLQDEFNNPKSTLKVLISLNRVGGVGMNLQGGGRDHILVMSPSANTTTALQGISRIIRASQEKDEVSVVRVHVVNSHDDISAESQLRKEISRSRNELMGSSEKREAIVKLVAKSGFATERINNAHDQGKDRSIFKCMVAEQETINAQQGEDACVDGETYDGNIVRMVNIREMQGVLK